MIGYMKWLHSVYFLCIFVVIFIYLLPSNIYAEEKVWLIAIGINDYETVYPGLHYAVRDAQGIVSSFTEAFSNLHVFQLIDEKATKKNIIVLLEKVTHLLKKEDRLIFYYSGHADIPPFSTEPYLLPYDANPASYLTTCIPIPLIQDYFSRLESNKIVFLFDTCYSGAVGNQGGNLHTTALDQIAVELISEHEERFVLCSSTANQVSKESGYYKYSLFTYYLLKGMSGEADANKDGKITVIEVHAYATRQIQERNESSQIPILYYEASTNNDFGLSSEESYPRFLILDKLLFLWAGPVFPRGELRNTLSVGMQIWLTGGVGLPLMIRSNQSISIGLVLETGYQHVKTEANSLFFQNMLTTQFIGGQFLLLWQIKLIRFGIHGSVGGGYSRMTYTKKPTGYPDAFFHPYLKGMVTVDFDIGYAFYYGKRFYLTIGSAMLLPDLNTRNLASGETYSFSNLMFGLTLLI